jgi:hypothetical protein
MMSVTYYSHPVLKHSSFIGIGNSPASSDSTKYYTLSSMIKSNAVFFSIDTIVR